MFCVYFSFANFASGYSISSKIATIKQTNLWEWLFVGVVIMTKKYHWYGTNELLELSLLAVVDLLWPFYKGEGGPFLD